MADLLTVQSLMQEALRYRDSGAATITVLSPGRIKGDVCDDLSQVPSVIASGAIRHDDNSYSSVAMPNGVIASYSITEGALSVFRVDNMNEGGVAISSTVAFTLGIAPGDSLVLTTGRTTVRGVYDWPNDGRRPGFDFAMLIPVPTSELFDECWVTTWPMTESVQTLLNLSIDNSAGDTNARTEYSQVNSALGKEFTGTERFNHRMTQFASVIVFGLTGLLSFVMVWSRRLELSSAQHVGVTWWAQLTQLLVEHGICFLVGSGIILGINAMIIASIVPVDTEGLWSIAWRNLAYALYGSLAGLVMTSCMITPKRLFRYFKVR
jgi:hypothetical protein